MAIGEATSTSARRRGPRKGDIKEQAILDQGVKLLSRRPFEQIGVDELARGAGISRPTFYFYFESKYAVLRALVERIAGDALVASEWLSDTDEPPEKTIESSIKGWARLWEDHGPVLRAAVETWGVPELRRFWEEIAASFVDALAEQIKRERRAGMAPEGPPSPRALATALIRMNERCFYIASIGAEPSLSDRELVTTLTTVSIRSVYGTDSPSGSR